MKKTMKICISGFGALVLSLGVIGFGGIDGAIAFQKKGRADITVVPDTDKAMKLAKKQGSKNTGVVFKKSCKSRKGNTALYC